MAGAHLGALRTHLLEDAPKGCVDGGQSLVESLVGHLARATVLR